MTNIDANINVKMMELKELIFVLIIDIQNHIDIFY